MNSHPMGPGPVGDHNHVLLGHEQHQMQHLQHAPHSRMYNPNLLLQHHQAMASSSAMMLDLNHSVFSSVSSGMPMTSAMAYPPLPLPPSLEPPAPAPTTRKPRKNNSSPVAASANTSDLQVKRAEHYEKNRDEILRKRREYYQRTRDERIKKQSEYYNSNRDRLKQRQNEYYHRNSDWKRLRQLEYYNDHREEKCKKQLEYYYKNREEKKAKQREYYRRNKNNILTRLKSKRNQVDAPFDVKPEDEVLIEGNEEL